MKQVTIERKTLTTPQIDNSDIRLAKELKQGDVIVCRGCRHQMYRVKKEVLQNEMIMSKDFAAINFSVPQLEDGMMFRCYNCGINFIDRLGQVSIQRRTKDGSQRKEAIQTSG